MNKKLLLGVAAPLLILGVGGVSARLIIASGDKAATGTPRATIPTVEVAEIRATESPSQIATTGVVKPALQVSLVPQVAGRIVWISPALMPGGRFSAGDVLARIDPRDYELAIKQATSKVQRADLELQLERGRQDVAKREWELLGSTGSEEEAALALRKPHGLAAQHHLEAAKSELRIAELKLERATIRAPFNGSVIDERVEVGQVVAPGSQIATLIGTDRFWVEVSVPVEALEFIDLPPSQARLSAGSEAVVTQMLTGNQRIVRRGRVARLVAALDSKSRRAQLIVAVDDPMKVPSDDIGGEGARGAALPLLPGAFVDVEVVGRIRPAYTLPRHAVRDGTRVWIVDDDSRLQERIVTVGWGGKHDVFITSGLEDGVRVVTSPLALPVVGMAVTVVGQPGAVSSR